MMVKTWASLTVGDRFLAADGYVYAVVDVLDETARTRTLLVNSAHSSLAELRRGIPREDFKHALYAMPDAA